MTALLTTRDLQELINVDKSTIYRMAEDGRLPAVKVGRQWRFSADRVAAMLGGAVDLPMAESRQRSDAADLRDLLVPEAAQSVTDLVADLFGVMAVLTDMEGRPLTEVANPCGFFSTIDQVPGAVEACTAGWRALGENGGFEPHFVPSHFGFLCARSFVRVGTELVGMVIVGGVTPGRWPPPAADLAASAVELELPLDLLTEHVGETYTHDEDHQRWILSMLPRISDLISQLATARSQLLGKLDAIALLAGAADQRSTT